MKQYLLNYTDVGSGPPIVLLHGLIASSRYWDGLTPLLAKKHRVIAIDLLGFGRSPKPHKSDYSLSDHVSSIQATLQQLGLNQPVLMVGHSLGAIIALAFAEKYPKEVKQLVLIGMPIFENPKEALDSIAANSRLPRQLLYGPLGRITCAVFCNGLRSFTQHLMPYYLRHLPRQVAKDSLYHTYRSYFHTLQHILNSRDSDKKISKLAIPAVILYGKQDRFLKDGILKLKGKNLKVQTLPAGHHLPLEMPQAVAATIN